MFTHWKRTLILLILIATALTVVYFAIKNKVTERYETSEGYGNDIVNWAGRLDNGTYMMYTLYIMDSGFCLRDEKLADLAHDLGSTKLWVDIKFQSIYSLNLLDNFYCEPSTEKSKTYRVLSIQLSRDAWYHLEAWQWDELQKYKDLIALPERPAS